MKKVFLFISVLMFAVMANATILDIAPNSPKSSDNVRREIRDHINPGDTLRLADGTYSESEVILFDKSVTVIAAEGAHPVIAQHYYSEITSGAKVKFIGIKFDGSLYNSGAGASDHCFCPYDDSDGNELRFENCEFTSFPARFIYIPSGKKLDTCIINNSKFSAAKSVVYNSSADVKYIKLDGCEMTGITEQVIRAASSASHMDSCIVNNCYFHENTQSAIYITDSSVEGVETCDRVRVTNSTFANTTSASNSVITIYNKGYAKEAAIKVIVDHCTFYNNTPQNTDHGCIRVYKSTDVRISNCIFAHPISIAQKATSCYGGTITNNLVYNYTYTSSGHRTDDITPVANVVANPLFVDAENNNFALAGNYPTVSPARGAATDGSDLGDPRWYTEATYPSTDFATPGYYCNGSHATLSTSDIAYESINNYIRYIDAKNPGTATWIINATRACYIQATLNLADNSSHSTSQKHIFQVQVFDKDNNEVGSVEEGPAWTGDGFTEYNTDKTLAGCIYIPEAGQYTIQLLNNREHSKCGIYGVTLTYAGGDFVTIPSADPIPFADAILSEKATRSLSPAEIHFGSPNAAQYAQWNAHASAGLYDITFTFTGTNHGIYQLIIKQGNNTICSDTKGQGGSGSVSFESVMIPADGDYVIQVANINPGADGYLTSVTAAAAALADAWIIDDEATTEEDIEAHDGVKYIPILKRSFVAGMYNTICVPFDSYDSELTSIFGAGYELLALESATLTDGVLVLNFQTVAGNSFAAGTPYLIKPTQDVVNPQFSKHTIHMYASNHVQHGGAADFIGTYIQKQLDADYDLFLGQNNILHFPSSTSAPLKGLRAYFHISAANAQAIKRARIVTQEQVITEIDLVNGENQGLIKTIENGQLIINLDGIRYNIMGGKIK